jgi:AraC family transcriptional regulator of adaptative response / DNA-3-methyladenine glycosylase II
LRLEPGGDSAATLARLQALPGVGAWTAQYVALRALRDPDALPVEDLGLRRARAPDGGPPLSVAELRRAGEAWRPWRSYAAMALWTGGADPRPHAARRARADGRPPRR